MGIFSLQVVSGWATEVKWSSLTSLIMTKVWGMLGTWFRFAGFSIHIFAYLVFLLSLLAAPFFLTRVTGFVKDPSGAFLKSKEQQFARDIVLTWSSGSFLCHSQTNSTTCARRAPGYEPTVRECQRENS